MRQLTSYFINTRVYSVLVLAFLVTGLAYHLFYPYDLLCLKVNAIHHTTADLFFRNITQLGDGVFVVLLGLALWIFHREEGKVILLGYLLSSIVTSIMKGMIFKKTPRPIEHFWQEVPNLHLVDGIKIHHWDSFPSGHTTSIFLVCSILSWYYRSTYFQWFWFLLALVTGFSRIYLFQHFLRDVLAGAFIGWVTAAFLLSGKFLKNSSEEAT